MTSETAAGSSSSRRTRYQYDAVGNQTQTIDPLGRRFRSEFDRLDRLVKSTAPDPDGPGALLPETTSFVYDAAGSLVAETNGAGETNRFAYDSRGLLVWSSDGRGDETTRRYDAVGNLVRQVDPALNVTTYAYDGLDRLATETTSAGTRTLEYNGQGLLEYATDRNGRAERYYYDRVGRKNQEKWYADRTAASSQTGFHDQFLWYYDELGRLKEDRLIHNTPAGTFDYRVTRSYQYDGLDRLTQSSNQSHDGINFRSSTASGAPTPETRQTYAYAYDSSGQTTTREQFVDGHFAARTKSTFNAFGELVRQEDKDTNSAAPPVDSATLDFESTDAVFSYLGDGSLASTTRYTDWDDALAGHRNRVQTSYAYDGAGRLQNIAHAQSRRTTASWPANTNLVAFAYGYDAAGRINAIGTDWNTAVAGLTTRTDETHSFAFDAAGQLTGVASSDSSQNAAYGYNANGNRAAAGEPGGGIDFYTTGADNRVSQDSTYSYVYDAEGNLTERRLASGNVLDQRFTWDHRNRLTKVENFDAAGLLTETVAYRYNAGDDLVYRSVDPAGAPPAVVEHYLVAGGRRALSFEQDGDVKRRYAYGPTGEVLFDQVFNAAGNPTLQAETDLLVPLGDHQHSTRVVLAHDANDATYVRQSIDYAQFGRVTTVLGADGLADSTGVVTAYAHHGSLLDAATGLQHKGERWYSPDLGRFVSEDPIQDGSNWYMAFGNDPVNHADPSGLSQQGHPLSGGLVPGWKATPAVNSIAGYQAAAPRVNQRELATYGGQVGAHRTQLAAIENQLSAAKTSLANRSFYELYDKSADRARIEALQSQRYDVSGQLSAARSNYTQVLNGWNGQRSTYVGTQYESIGGAIGSGLKTGGKAVGNSFASAGTLGFYEGPFGVTQRDLDNGYATSRLIAGASAELLVGVATGGAARLGAAAGGRAALIGKTALAFDAGGNAVGVGRGALDAYQNGLSLGSGVQIVGGAFGLGGNVAAGGRQLGELISDAGRVRVESFGAYSGVPIPKRVYLEPKGVTPYQVGLYNELEAASRVGDKLALHHVGQGHAFEQLIPGYNRQTAPAIVLQDAVHRQIPNLRGVVSDSARNVLARDIRNLRSFTQAPNNSLQQLISLNKQYYPQAFSK